MYEYRGIITRVVDGDTLDIEVDLGFSTFIKQRFRLARIDTPEIYGVRKDSLTYKLGQVASNAVKDIVSIYNGNCIIKTTKDKQGKYGRYIAEIYFNRSNPFNLSDYLVEKGFATYETY